MQTENFGKRLREKIIELKLASPADIVGCSSDEIEEVMRSQNVTQLPELYIQFLRFIGKFNRTFWGEVHSYPFIRDFKSDMYDFIDVNLVREKLDTQFFFWTDWNNFFCYFNPYEENPTIFQLNSDGKKFSINITLLEFLTYFINRAENEKAMLAFQKEFEV